MRNIKLTIEYDGKEFNRMAKTARKIKYTRNNRKGNRKNNRRASGFNCFRKNR